MLAALVRKQLASAKTQTEREAILVQAHNDENIWRKLLDTAGVPLAEAFGALVGAPPGVSSQILHGGVELIDQLFPEVFSSNPNGGKNAAIASQVSGMLPAAYADMFERTPAMVKTEQRGDGIVTTVKHSELLADLLSTAGEATYGLDINPGLEATFPWLSGIADEFQSYNMKDLKFYFNPQEGTEVAGSFVGGLLSDSTDATPTMDKDIASLDRGVAAGINRPICLDVADSSLDVIGPAKFVRNSNESNEQKRTSDSGKLVVKLDTTTIPAAEPVGYLLSSYECEFMHPVAESAPSDLNTQIFKSVFGVDMVVANADIVHLMNYATPASPSYGTLKLTDPFGITMDGGGGFKCPRGWWDVEMNADLNVAAPSNFSMSRNGFIIELNGMQKVQADLPAGIMYVDMVGETDDAGIPPILLGARIPFSQEMIGGEYSGTLTSGKYYVSCTSRFRYYSDGKTSIFYPQFTYYNVTSTAKLVQGYITFTPA